MEIDAIVTNSNTNHPTCPISVLDFADVKSDYEECGCDVVACEYTLFRTTVTATPLPDTEIEHKLKAWNSPRHFDRLVPGGQRILQKFLGRELVILYKSDPNLYTNVMKHNWSKNI